MKPLSKNLKLILLAAILFLPVNETFAQVRAVKVEKTVVVKRPPAGCRVVKVKKTRYHTHKGVYYVKVRNGYKIVPTPVGVTLRVLPRGCKKLVVGRRVYFVKNNVYYRYNNRSRAYVVVTRPV
ncbi:MAG: DUF6515 family protein [Rhodothermaceae bacterium]